MGRPKICAVISDNNFNLANGAARFVDFYEVRIDLIGDGWQDWVKKLRRPWIASNRLPEEGGKWSGDENLRISKLCLALDLGAAFVDIELRSPDLVKVRGEAKKRYATCIISSHNIAETPPGCDLGTLIRRQIEAKADICKIVTSAQRYEDNLTVLRLLQDFPEIKLVALAEGGLGITSRMLSPLFGGYLTYGYLVNSREEDGRPAAAYMRSFYEAVKRDKSQ